MMYFALNSTVFSLILAWPMSRGNIAALIFVSGINIRFVFRKIREVRVNESGVLFEGAESYR